MAKELADQLAEASAASAAIAAAMSPSVQSVSQLALSTPPPSMAAAEDGPVEDEDDAESGLPPLQQAGFSTPTRAIRSPPIAQDADSPGNAASEGEARRGLFFLPHNGVCQGRWLLNG